MKIKTFVAVSLVLVLFGVKGWYDTLPSAQPVAHRVAAKPKDDSAQLAGEACATAQRAVRDRLKSPSSAEFPSCFLGLAEHSIRATDDRRTIFVMGYVDADNSFGAKLRRNYGVEMTRQHGMANLRVVTVAMDE